MTRKEKLEAIYKEMANKELTLGCKLTVVESFGPCDGVVFCSDSLGSKVLRDDQRKTTETKNNDFFIIGHPVMIGTIFEWYSSSRGFINSQFVMNLIEKWTGYDKSIDDQSDECIDYVYSLILSKSME